YRPREGLPVGATHELRPMKVQFMIGRFPKRESPRVYCVQSTNHELHKSAENRGTCAVSGTCAIHDWSLMDSTALYRRRIQLLLVGGALRACHERIFDLDRRPSHQQEGGSASMNEANCSMKVNPLDEMDVEVNSNRRRA